MKTITIIATTLVVLSATAEAQAYCMRPSAPSCASSYGSFDDEWEFDRCKRDVENFQSEIESFIQCKQTEIDEANDKAQDAAREAEEAASEAETVASDAKRDVNQVSSEYNDAVRSFNRRAGGY